MAKKQKTKVTGAETSIHTPQEARDASYGLQVTASALTANKAAKAIRKKGLAGTPQNPSPMMYGVRHAANVLGEDSSGLPMSKRKVRSLTTNGPKPTIQKSPMSGRDVPLPATSNKQLVKDAKSALKTARKTKRQSRRA